MCSLVTSIFLYACEPWTLTAELQRRVQAMEMRFSCKILCISYKDHVTNEEVCAKIQQAIGPHKDLLTIVKGHRLKWYVGHVSCSLSLTKTILQGTVKGRRRQGRQKERWEDNIKGWTGLKFTKSQGQWRTEKNGRNWLFLFFLVRQFLFLSQIPSEMLNLARTKIISKSTKKINVSNCCVDNSLYISVSGCSCSIGMS